MRGKERPEDPELSVTFSLLLFCKKLHGKRMQDPVLQWLQTLRLKGANLFSSLKNAQTLSFNGGNTPYNFLWAGSGDGTKNDKLACMNSKHSTRAFFTMIFHVGFTTMFTHFRQGIHKDFHHDFVNFSQRPTKTLMQTNDGRLITLANSQLDICATFESH